MALPPFPLFTSLLFLTSLPLLSFCLLESPTISSPSCEPGRSWVVQLNHSSEPHGNSLDTLAESVALEAGLESHGQIGQLHGHYLLCRVTDKHPSAAHQTLDTHPNVIWHSQENVLRRSKRSLIFNDPKYPSQWHLHNDMRQGMDINVTGVWEQNITGVGVTVVVVDDGLQHTLEDIQPNYSPEGSYDLNSNDPDPMPHPDSHSDNHHGTRCAGEIAAVPNNSFCAVGVAYGSKVAGIRVLDGPLTDSMEAVAFNKHYQVNDVYSCSWGPDDDGRTVDGPHPLGQAALKHGVLAGRRGFGSIFVVASGNGGLFNDNCNYDGYANSIYTVTIGAVDENGKMPFYAEECASMLAVTSDWSLQEGTGCTEGHTGTSAAAPLAAGMVALMLEVRPCLTWRDIQHIITYTATQYDTDADWKTNGAGFHHSHKHGFGLLNAWRLVNAAKSPVLKEGKTIPAFPNQLVLTWNVSALDLRQSGIKTLEHVAVTLTITHPRRGDIEIVLVCPSGMTSLIGAKRALDTDATGFTDWTFSTVRCWGEQAVGQYSLHVTDHITSDLTYYLGTLKHWKLTLYGSEMSFNEVLNRQSLVEEAMGGQFLSSNFSIPCPPGLDIPPEVEIPFTSNSFKIVLLVGCFALCWSLYYVLELMLTHVHWHRAGTTKDGQFLEMQPLTDLEAKMPLMGNSDT
ncbi:Proprotein convertase subtilisin/kexin type 7 [Bagarius yarrelli]|uniref:Proprotein convertase subtilisin/kexin type 7 n=1 Tax=Bagarius yarrelli TaxID=175774 RepID=A0A556U6E4_BAGYA|nr:Proprotein convertase subtilisin/kexin type 7 [Bagarius yarrelli]